MKPIRKFLISHWPLLLLLVLAGLLLSYKIDKPFWGHHDWNGVYWGSVARNFARYGIFATKFAMVLGNGPIVPTQYNYSFHYAPLFPMIWAVFLKIFGFSQWASRLMSVTFSLGAITVFWFLVKKHFDLRTAIVSSILWIITPMFVYFGKMPVHEIPLMFFVLLAFFFYLSKRFRLLWLTTIIAGLITWPGYFIVPAVTAHWLLFKNNRTVKFNQIIVLWLSCFLLFLLFLFHDYLVTGSIVGGGVKETFLLRVGGVSPIQYLSTLLRWSWTYYFLLVPLSIMGLLLTKNKILVLFLAYAVIYPIVFRDASFRHDYLLIYFWPFLALGSGVVINHFLQKKPIALILTVAVIIVATTVLRYKFVLALENSDIYKESARFGMFIDKNSSPTDKILVVLADPSVPWDGWFIGYYADRVIVGANADKTAVYSSGGKMSIGADINNSGTK